MPIDDVVRGLTLIMAILAAFGTLGDATDVFAGIVAVVAIPALLIGFLYTVRGLIPTVANWWDRNTD
jgi:hypothetical protein